MFSMKSTWKEMKTTKPVDTALGDLFPTCWSILLQGHEEETMEQIHDRVHMEWGEAFWSQPLVNCANVLMETAEKQKFLFVPLWHTQKEGWIPKEDQNDEEGVWLFTGNPDVDSQAFMHSDDCASIPPYLYTAVSKERRQEKGTPGFEIYEGFDPQPGEKIFDKTVNSSFKGTGLLEYLVEKNVSTVAVVGLQTDYCIDATIKCGFEHGFKVIVPKNANSTFDNAFMTGEQSYKYYNEFMWKGRYVECISVEETIERMKG